MQWKYLAYSAYITKKYIYKLMGYVYLIHDVDNDIYKIGVTRSQNSKRLMTLQTGNGSDLRVIHIYECEYPFRLETMLHKKYINNRIKNEWFDLADHEVIHFEETCNRLNQTIQIMKDNPYFAKNLK